MGRHCTVCVHEARAEIEAQIRAKTRYQDIADRFGLHRKAIGRHKLNHMDAPMVQVEKAEIAPLWLSWTPQERLEWLIGEACTLMAEAKAKSSSADTRARVLGECRKVVEFAEKIAGRMPAEQVQQLMVVVPHDHD